MPPARRCFWVYQWIQNPHCVCFQTGCALLTAPNSPGCGAIYECLSSEHVQSGLPGTSMLVLEGPLHSTTIRRRRGRSHAPQLRQKEGRASLAPSQAFRPKEWDCLRVPLGASGICLLRKRLSSRERHGPVPASGSSQAKALSIDSRLRSRQGQGTEGGKAGCAIHLHRPYLAAGLCFSRRLLFVRVYRMPA